MASSTVNQPELTAEQIQRILVKPLEAASVFLAAGPRIFDITAAGVVRVPKLVSMGAPLGTLRKSSLPGRPPTSARSGCSSAAES